MLVLNDPQAVQSQTSQWKKQGSIAFVPTMGSLHEGHLSLIRTIKQRADVVVLSVYVNPTQFGPSEDFDSYPRDLTQDSDLCIAEGVDYMFTPETSDIYPKGPGTWVEVADLSHRLEGASRAGHFRGVATIVLKLLNIIRPDLLALGQKDAQQVVVLRRMARDLMLDVEIVVGSTIREDDGLALSSRNAKLTPEQRQAAAAIFQALELAQQALGDGTTDPVALISVVQERIEQEPLLQVDYISVAKPDDLEPVDGPIEQGALLLVAVFAGEIRLLDNIVLVP